MSTCAGASGASEGGLDAVRIPGYASSRVPLAVPTSTGSMGGGHHAGDMTGSSPHTALKRELKGVQWGGCRGGATPLETAQASAQCTLTFPRPRAAPGMQRQTRVSMHPISFPFPGTFEKGLLASVLVSVSVCLCV